MASRARYLSAFLDLLCVSLVGVEPRTGRELWRHGPWPEKWGAACVDLLVHDGKVFVATAEQHRQCARFSLRGGRLTQDWASRALSCYTGGCVLLGGHLYGVNQAGFLKCLDWETGKEKWAQRGFDEHGTLTAAEAGNISPHSGHSTLT